MAFSWLLQYSTDAVAQTRADKAMRGSGRGKKEMWDRGWLYSNTSALRKVSLFFMIVFISVPTNASRNYSHTMVENGKKHRQNSHPIIHCPTREGVSEVSERANE